MIAAFWRALDKVHWKIIGRWLLAYFVVLVFLACLDAIHLGLGCFVAVALAGGMVANKFEPRRWVGKLDTEWWCPTCSLHIRSTSAVWVAQVRNTHECPRAGAA